MAIKIENNGTKYLSSLEISQICIFIKNFPSIGQKVLWWGWTPVMANCLRKLDIRSIRGVLLAYDPLKGFLGDVEEFEHNEEDNDFTEFHSVING